MVEQPRKLSGLVVAQGAKGKNGMQIFWVGSSMVEQPRKLSGLVVAEGAKGRMEWRFFGLVAQW